jgi:transcriptional regulator GlxA family with amidase domain
MRTVVVLAFEGMQLLDLAGPVEVFRTATRLGATPPYRTLIATPSGEAIRSESGVLIGADESFPNVRRYRRQFNTLLVVGGQGAQDAANDASLVNDLAVVSHRAERTASVCTGAFLLAAAGVLSDRKATTHWASCAQLADEYPDIEVVPDCIHVQDGNIWTSAGVTAGIDLALALVEADHGAELAHTVAGWLVVFTRRPGGQAQFSAQLRAQPARTPAIAAVQQWLPDHLCDDLTVEALARQAAMSTRSFARGFVAETGATPAAYVESLRIEAAKRLLATSDLTVLAIARAVGLKHAETLHRAFRRRAGTTPESYREHFARQAS